MPLSENVYSVATAFEMIEWVEQWICIKFCVNLEHSSAKTVWMIQKAAAMGKQWLEVSSQQCTHSYITSHAVFLWNIKSFRGLSPTTDQIWCPVTFGFPQNSRHFEREEISNHWWDWGKYNQAADGNWENCVRSQGAYFEGDWDIIILCTMFLVPCIFLNKCLYFSYFIAGYFMDRPRILWNDYYNEIS